MALICAFDLERRLGYFDQVVADLISGNFRRNTFQPWEIEILLDIQACGIPDSNKRETLRRYQKAAHRWVDRGGRTMLLLSEYLAKRHRRTPLNGNFAPEDAQLVP